MENIVNIPLHIYISSTAISKVNTRGDAVTLTVPSRLPWADGPAYWGALNAIWRLQDELSLQGQEVQVSFVFLL